MSARAGSSAPSGLRRWSNCKYNTEHRHGGLGLLTPHDVHYGLAGQRLAARATVLATAYAVHPERFPGGLPQPPACPTEVWINPPHSLRRLPRSIENPALRLALEGPFA